MALIKHTLFYYQHQILSDGFCNCPSLVSLGTCENKSPTNHISPITHLNDMLVMKHLLEKNSCMKQIASSSKTTKVKNCVKRMQS
jgi:predicted nucleic acid-binding Zn finger protein